MKIVDAIYYFDNLPVKNKMTIIWVTYATLDSKTCVEHVYKN